MKETVKLSTTSLSAMKTVYIHIGLEKTGTTTLQKFLTDNESVLRKKRFYYLCDDTKLYFEGIGHFPLAACFHVDSPKFISEEKFHSPAEVLRTLKFDINRCDGNVILSCEHLSSRLDKREYLESIRTSLPNQNIKIICYLRRQDEMALDAYSTMVCYGRVNPITIAEVIGCNSDYFDYKKICDLWASVFGHENVILREYKRSNFEGGDIRRDFLNLLKIDCNGFQFGQDENISLDASQVELLRSVNNHLHSHSAEDRNLYEKSQNERWLLLKYLPNGLPLDSLFEKPERESILRHFQGGNFELADSFNDADFLKHWKVEDVELSHEARAGTHQDSFYAETISYLVSELNEVIQKKKSLTTERRHLLEKNRLLQANYEKITKSKSWQVTLPIRLLAASVRWLKNEIKSIVK